MIPFAGADLTPPLKWHGGKHYLAAKILALMPAHVHYVEPYFGGGAVLLAKDPEGVSEVVNDLNGELTNFWRVLQGEESFARFHRLLEAVPFSEAEYTASLHPSEGATAVERAAQFFVRCRQSLAGRMDAFAPLSRTRTRRAMNEQASAWLTAVAGLPAVHTRLKRVVVLNRPALEVIRSQDGADTLFYLDPPYLHETRTAPAAYGDFEMAESEHRALLDAIRQCAGRVMLSGYPSALYDDALHGWKRHLFDLPNNAAAGDSKRRTSEVLWCNF